MQALPDIPALAACEEERLLKLWEGLGYYSRARNLRACAITLVRDYGGDLPDDPDLLVKLPGIGPYTAGAIASIAYHCPAPAVDGNVLRILSRLYDDEEDVLTASAQKRGRQTIREAMTDPAFDCDPGDYNQALMELGERICLPGEQVRCEACPVKDCCLAGANGRAPQLPTRINKTKRQVQPRTVLIISNGRQVLLARRPKSGLLGGMYELPGLDGHLDEEAVCAFLKANHITCQSLQPAGESRHRFSHIDWEMQGWQIAVGDGDISIEELAGARTLETDALVWADAQQLADTYPLPSAFRGYRKVLKACLG